MWGQALYILYASIYLRIIPTRVGTRWIAVINQAVNEDHPHACGDKLRGYEVFKILVGSSPRVWGQAQVLGKNQCAARIIPTRVGTSCARLTHSQHLAGSSPRVWGQDWLANATNYDNGIIPTRVGTRQKRRVNNNAK